MNNFILKLTLPLLIICTACTEGNIPEDPDTDVTIEDSLESTVKIDTTNENLKALLDNPIDLPSFKDEYGPSNGGGGSAEAQERDFDIPDTIGQLYSYFYFYKLGRALPSRPTEGTLFNKFTITVYRKGESIGDFFDHEKDHLLMVESAIDNTVIGDLNWFGKSKDELISTYGEPQFKSGDVLVYYHDNRVLSCRLMSGRVIWYKYARLNKELELPSEIPAFLFKF